MKPGRPKTEPPVDQLSFESRFLSVTVTAVAPSPANEPPPVAAPDPPSPAASAIAAPAVDAPAVPAVAVAAAPAGVPAPPAKPEPRILAVAELIRAARVTLEARFADVWVEGEITGLKRSGPGHVYFCLKDAEAQLECVMFSREAGRLKFRPQDGMQVRCRGRLTIFEGRGRFQMTVVAIEPAGAGVLALAFEQLKQKLAAEGLFDPKRKRPLPFLPRRIGVVTSPQGAVIRDIVRVAHRRFPVPILLAPAAVQGDGAAHGLVAALRQIVRVPDVDLVILARGGGSLEDLWAFNEEVLARAIAACPLPVISAVGHETDFTIADFVADLRAPTPSAAAEMAVPVMADLLAEVAVLRRRLGRGLDAELRTCRLRLERARARVGDPRRLIDDRRQALDELAARATSALRAGMVRRRNDVRGAEARLYRLHPQRRIAEQRGALATLERRLAASMGAVIARRRRALDGVVGKLDGMSPLKVLERGYSLVRGPDGHVVVSADRLAKGDQVTVTFRDGDARARVEEITKK